MAGAEFSHIVKLSEIGAAPLNGTLSADADERRSLAQRFDLPDIASLTADYRLQAEDRGILFKGILDSRLQQRCVVAGDPFPVQVREEFDILFVPATEDSMSEEEVELSEEDCDRVEYDGAQIDLGEALAQTLYLALDPYPRGPDADAVARAKGLKSEEEAGPFGALAALKDKLG